MALQSTAGGKGDIAGEASNAYKVAEAKALWGYIKKRPIYGYGFGKVASDFGTGYSYELSYLDLLLKAGFIGLLLFLSFPLRLIVDALAPASRSTSTCHGSARGIGAAGVVVGVVAGILPPARRTRTSSQPSASSRSSHGRVAGRGTRRRFG